MLQEIISGLKNKVKYRIWLISDLQQSIPQNAKLCLSTAVEDFHQLKMPCNQIWYLGDAVEGQNLANIEEMAQMQIKMLNSFNVPVRYVLGNHDFDYFRSSKDTCCKITVPFYERILKETNWLSIESYDSFYFFEHMKDFSVLFLSDHANVEGSWFTTHGVVHGNADKYPYTPNTYAELNTYVQNLNKPVITVSHYAFSGGNRPSQLQDRLLPLPENVKMHFYGHAHIGDKQWAGKDCYRKLACVDDQNIPQINISSLENRRGNAVRSALLEVYEDISFGIYFRNHSEKKWEEYYFLNKA
jgi:predicted phosphodiesterase